MESNFYIASRLAKIVLTDLEKERILIHFKGSQGNIEKQNDFFSYCKTWKLVPWIHVQMQRNDLTRYLDTSVQYSFSDFYNRIKSENESRNSTALNFLNAFIEEKIDVAVLKGNLLMHKVYKDTGYKKMNDFDMLIHVEDWGRVQEIYDGLGYIPLGFGWGGEKGKAAKFSHAGLSYVSPDYKCITGTQWGLKSPTSGYSVSSADIWESASAFDFYGTNIKQLSPEYNLLHLVLHMGIYKCGIRDCMDVYNLLLAEKNFNEDMFAEICRKSKAVDKACFTLRLTDKCSESISGSLLNKLRPSGKTFIIKRLNSRLHMADKTGDFQLSYNDYFHDVEMTVFLFSLYPLFHKKAGLYLRLIGQLFWPTKDIAHKLSDLGNEAAFGKRLIARMKAPVLTFRLIGEEIGLLITLLLFIKMFFDTLFSLMNYLFRKQSYFEYLHSRGISAKEINQIVANIQ